MASTVTVVVELCVHETDAAILCKVDGKDHWIPRSLLEEDVRDESYKGDKDFELEVPKWFADKEGIDYED